MDSANDDLVLRGDALKALKEMYGGTVESINQNLYWNTKAICSVPKVDAVLVVRCKDCIYRNDNVSQRLPFSGLVYRCEIMNRFFEDEFYCAHGERRKK